MRAEHRVYVSPDGNQFMDEIAQLVAAGLCDLGRPSTVVTDGVPEAFSGGVNLVVAPHEYYGHLLRQGRPESEVRRAAEVSVAVTTEQPGTTWYAETLPYLHLAPLTLDINQHAAEQLAASGIPARFLQLGYHSSWDRWGGDHGKPRSVDIGFLGALTDRRHRFLAEAASRLWEPRCDLRLFEVTAPRRSRHRGFLTGDSKWTWLADVKVLLNVHRSDVPYFEWMRVLEAMANGCVLVSDPSSYVAPLRPGEHFVEAPLPLLADYAVGLLADPEVRTKMAAAAYELVRTEMVFTDRLAPLLEEVESAGRQAPGRKRPSPALPEPHVAPAPQMPQALEDLARTERTIGFRVKELMVAERSLRRELDQWGAILAHGDADHLDVETTPAWDAAASDVAVVVPLYNHAAEVGQAIDSVLSSGGVAVELIVVDDHSTDSSVEVVRACMEAAPWAPIMLVRKAANRGLASARNTGFAHARAPLVFALDADDLVYPNGLAKLASALDGSAAAFAYGIVDRFGSGDPGVDSCLPWDVARLCRSNYITSMILLRRHVWEAIGGYDPHMNDAYAGWEDYELLLHLAAQGYEGVLVPEMVARYRQHGPSMLSTMNLDVSLPLAHLHRAYPALPWPAP